MNLKALIFPTASDRLARAIGGFDKAIKQLETAGAECLLEWDRHEKEVARLSMLQVQANKDAARAFNVATNLKTLVDA